MASDSLKRTRDSGHSLIHFCLNHCFLSPIKVHKMLMEVLRIYSSRSSQTPSQLIFVGVRDRVIGS
jgi:hypothetical protein